MAARSWPGLLLAAWLLLGGSGAAMAQALVIDAPSAQALPSAGGVLIDIRTPSEITATGRPVGAVAIPLQGDDMTFSPTFLADVATAVGSDRQRPVAVIDGNGARANFVGKLLVQQGYATVLTVGEGMLGNNLGPGWIARGLPVER